MDNNGDDGRQRYGNTASLYCLTTQKNLIQMLAFVKFEFKEFAAMDIVF